MLCGSVVLADLRRGAAVSLLGFGRALALARLVAVSARLFGLQPQGRDEPPAAQANKLDGSTRSAHGERLCRYLRRRSSLMRGDSDGRRFLLGQRYAR